jgi:hypothetical protein
VIYDVPAACPARHAGPQPPVRAGKNVRAAACMSGDPK